MNLYCFLAMETAGNEREYRICHTEKSHTGKALEELKSFLANCQSESANVWLWDLDSGEGIGSSNVGNMNGSDLTKVDQY